MMVDELLGRLDGVHGGNGTWTARCPAHEDRSPSLTIGLGDDDKILLHCHADCSVNDIVAALGLTIADLFATNKTTANGGEVARYRYVDEQGVHLFDVVRSEGKKFHQEPANGARGRGAMKGVRLVLYRLPEVTAAVAAGRTVYVCEGEKDVDRVRAEDVTATTNPMGAGKWSRINKGARVALAGATVIVIADRDEPGRRHAAQVRASLVDVAASVAIVEPAAGKDVSDHLAAGHTLADLLPIAEATTEDFDDVADEEGCKLFDDVAAFLERFIVFPSPHARDAVTLWCQHTHVFDIFEVTPRLVIRSGDKRAGKTRLLRLIEPLCRNARRSSNMSVAYLFRRVELDQPTLLFDEVDAIFGAKAGNNHEDLRSLLNDGWEHGATVGRIVGEGKAMKPHDFPVFTPCALAAIGSLPDTIMDRAVAVSMKRRLLGEPVEPFRRRRVRPEHEALHRRLAAWAERHAIDLGEADPVMPEGVDDRHADVWEPLLAIADAAGGDWPERSRTACVDFAGVRALDDDSWRTTLLGEIIDVFDDRDVDRIASKELGERLVERGAWEGTLTSQKLAALLRPFGVRTVQEWVAGKTWRGYLRRDFDDVVARYSPPSSRMREKWEKRESAGSADQDSPSSPGSNGSPGGQRDDGWEEF